MNKIQFSATGFPETIESWEHLQDSYLATFSVLADVVGTHVIIKGVEQNNGNLTDGFVVINSEFLPFIGGVNGGYLKIVETIENVNYNTDINNDSILENLPAYITRFATVSTDVNDIDVANMYRLQSLKAFQQLPFVQDENYVHTDENYTNYEKNKLNGIEAGAEKNVQANWSQSDSDQDDFIKNKPNINCEVLAHGKVFVGDVSSSNNTLVTAGDILSASNAGVDGARHHHRIRVNFQTSGLNAPNVFFVIHWQSSHSSWHHNDNVLVSVGTIFSNVLMIYLKELSGSIQSGSVCITALKRI